MDKIILQFFEGIRNPALTAFFGAFSLLGEAVVLSAIVIVFFWLAPRRMGETALVAVMSSFCVNSLLKHAVARQRPYRAGVVLKEDPPFSAALDDNSSFPSGHAQMTTGFFALAAPRRRAFQILSWVLIAIIALSRLYFGVHYPSDVLGGLLLGGAIAALWAFAFRLKEEIRSLLLLGLAAIALIPILFLPAHDYIQAAGLFSGGAVSLALLHFVSTREAAPFFRRLLRIPVGAALLLATFAFTLLFPQGEAFSLLKWFLLALSAIFCSQIVFEMLSI